MRKAYSILLIMLQASFLIFNVKAEWSGETIIIRSDGSIYPSYAPIVTTDRTNYVLTDDITVSSGNGIIVERDNIVIDGDGHMLKGSIEEGNVGISLKSRRHVTIKNIVIENFCHGISTSDSSYTRIIWSKVRNNKYIGIAFYDSSNSEVIENDVENNKDGIYLHHSSKNKVIRNKIKDNNEHGLHLYDSSNNEIGWNQMENNGHDNILLMFSSNNQLIENIIKGGEYGIYIHYSSGNGISRNKIEKSFYGVYLHSSSKNGITENELNANYGLYLEGSRYNEITENDFIDCGLFVSDSYENIVKDNVVNDKPLVYLEKDVNKRISDAGQVVLTECENVIVENLKLSKTTVGIQLWKTKNSKITSNEIENSEYAIYLYDSCDNEITENKMKNNNYGLALYGSERNKIIKNEFVNCGLYLAFYTYDGVIKFSYYNVIKNNTVNGKPVLYLENEADKTIKDVDIGQIILIFCKNISLENLRLSNTTIGIELFGTKDSSIVGNKLENNLYGIYLLASSNNKIYHNDFINNNKQVYTYRSVNIWDYELKGNYWSDYSGIDSNSDGIGDTPYTIDDENKDRYPLMAPYGYFLVNILTNYGTASGSGWYRPGTTISISISQTVIDYSNGTRQVFKGWLENGFLINDKQSFYIIVDKPRKIVADWRKEHWAEIYSDWGFPTGSGWHEAGSLLRISIDKTVIDHNNGTRRIFKGWYEANSLTSEERSFYTTIDRPRTIIANWDTEYEVRVSSDKGSPTGSGWYKRGTTAIVSISETQMEKDFLSYCVFEGWKVDGKLASASPTYSFIVDGPITLVAVWGTRFKLISVGIIMAILFSSVATAALLMKHKPPPPPPPEEKLPLLPPAKSTEPPEEPIWYRPTVKRMEPSPTQPSPPPSTMEEQIPVKTMLLKGRDGAGFFDFTRTKLKGSTIGSRTNPSREGEVEIQEFLGAGSYSIVYKGLIEGKPTAIKISGIVKKMNNEHYVSPPQCKGEIMDFFNQIRTLGLLKRRRVLQGELNVNYLKKLVETSIQLSNFNVNSSDEFLSKYPIGEWLHDLALFDHNIATVRLYNKELFEKFEKSNPSENIFTNPHEFAESPPFFAMQLADGDLLKLSKEYRGSRNFPEILKAAFSQMAAATSLVYVCSTIPGEEAQKSGRDFVNPRIHKDIKPENILFKKHKKGFRFVVTDFGLAETQRVKQQKEWQVGTPYYMPPEYILYPYESILPSFDVYSLGMTVLSLTSRPYIQSLLIASTQHKEISQEAYVQPILEALKQRFTDEQVKNMVNEVRSIVYSYDDPFSLSNDDKNSRIIQLQGKIEDWGLYPPEIDIPIDEGIKNMLIEMTSIDCGKRPKSCLEVYFRLRQLLGDAFTKYTPKRKET
ncbi:MAG: NosD domain-containing protein [Thermoproteota archaeon]